MCGCRRNRSATSGKPRSAPPPSPGWAITRSAMWLCFRGRLTARWRWRPRVLCWARRLRSVTSASSRRCCWMSRPRSAPRRRCHRRASSTSPWRPIRGANKRGKLPRSYMPQRMSSHLRTTRPRCLPRIRAARMAPRCASAWTSVVFSTVRRSPVSAQCTPARRQPAPCWPRSRYPAKSARNKMLTVCTRRCWMPVFSPLRLIRTSRPWAKVCWGCRWVSVDSAPTVLPATPATATHG